MPEVIRDVYVGTREMLIPQTAADDDDDYGTDVKPGAKKINKGKGKAKDEADEGEVNTRPDDILPSTKMTRLG